MKTFNYTIQDALGIHASPAGVLVKEVKKFESKITIALTKTLPLPQWKNSSKQIYNSG